MARRDKPPSLLSGRVKSIVRVKPQLPHARGPFTTVRFYRLTQDATVESMGTLSLKDGRIVADPADSIALQNVLAEPVWLPEGDGWRFLYPDTQPEDFLRALPKQYHGSYFWCEAVA